MGNLANSLTGMAVMRQNRRTRKAIEHQTAANQAAHQAWQQGYNQGWWAGYHQAQAEAQRQGGTEWRSGPTTPPPG